MDSILIKDTTKEERERIVAESIGNINGSCDGCAAGLAEMYQDYIDGKKEIRDINMEFSAQHTAVTDDFDEDIHDPCLRFQR
ncbi:MAG: purine biosynthesis protein PurH [Mogibacterium sp.]|nr:purine biosynthesis protein PurH [Mogibacterium sp.]